MLDDGAVTFRPVCNVHGGEALQTESIVHIFNILLSLFLPSQQNMFGNVSALLFFAILWIPTKMVS